MTTQAATGPSREVRFSVVMYGGVSLAIYINGVAQEMLRLVRSTAEAPGRPLSGSELAYRKASFLLDPDFFSSGSDPDQIGLKLDEALAVNAAPPTRFVVDVISGTSAGGINGIFLAKALANGQNMDELQSLWVTEGDISLLINDRLSVKDEKRLAHQSPPVSALNSERMYFKLLSAFNGMDAAAATANPVCTPLVDELDLFVTTTDIRGVPLPIALSDGVVKERRHRNVFQFVFADEPAPNGRGKRNDFEGFYNPFLAFAARCTSSFPVAFEPMALKDGDRLLGRLSKPNWLSSPDRDESWASDCKRWRHFFADYPLPPEPGQVPLELRPFGDGGYLDNKPFTYATDTIARRNANVPVERKLLYVEPSPEHPEDEVDPDAKPDAIENAMAAMLQLPQRETIREDLRRIIDRNRLIERMKRVITGVERDLDMADKNPDAADASDRELGRMTDDQYAEKDLAYMVRLKKRSYVAYHRLDIASVTDDIANIICRIFGVDETSAYGVLFRNLVRAWRDQRYCEYSANDPRETMNRFLTDFNFAYRFRRLNFVRGKADELVSLDARSRELLDLCRRRFPDVTFWSHSLIGNEEKVEFCAEVLRIKTVLNDSYRNLRRMHRALLQRPASNGAATAEASPLVKSISELKSVILDAIKRDRPAESPKILDYFLGDQPSLDEPTDAPEWSDTTDPLARRARAFVRIHPDVYRKIDAAADRLREALSAMKSENDRCLDLFSVAAAGTTDPAQSPAVRAARICLGYYYDRYDDFDSVLFPVGYGADLGEPAVVDILRVSPEDATALVEERATGCRKLAGTSIFHFGAFFDELWRRNDIMWGRLDGAERLLSALLPNHPYRRRLIGEAQAAIVLETTERLGGDELYSLLVETAMRTVNAKPDADLVGDFLTRVIQNANPSQRVELEGRIDISKARNFYNATFARRSRLEPETAMRSAARLTTVVGQMLEGISHDRRVGTKSARWVSRIGLMFWGLVEVAVPRSFANLAMRHWLKLLYFVEAVGAILGLIFVSSAVQQLALTALGVTLAIHLATLLLGDVLLSQRTISRRLAWLGGLVIVSFAAFGAFAALAVFGGLFAWRKIRYARWLLYHQTILGFHATTLFRWMVPVVALGALIAIGVGDWRRRRAR